MGGRECGQWTGKQSMKSWLGNGNAPSGHTSLRESRAVSSRGNALRQLEATAQGSTRYIEAGKMQYNLQEDCTPRQNCQATDVQPS